MTNNDDQIIQSLSWNIGCITDHTSQNVWNNSPLATFCCCKELRATQTTVQRNLSRKFGTVHRWIMKLVGWSRTIRAVLLSLSQQCHRASSIHLYSSLPFLHRASKRKRGCFGYFEKSKFGYQFSVQVIYIYMIEVCESSQTFFKVPGTSSFNLLNSSCSSQCFAYFALRLQLSTWQGKCCDCLSQFALTTVTEC